jgi:hypothetical protein
MDIQVNKDQLYRVVIKWLKQNYGNLIPTKYKNFSNKIFYLNSDNDIIMDYNERNGFVWISYVDIWSKVESIFHLNEDDERPILKEWLREVYGLDDVTPYLDRVNPRF